MLTTDQIAKFKSEGYLIVEDVVAPELLVSIRGEYDAVMNGLYADWHAQGLVSDTPEGLDLWGKLDRVRAAGIEWFQPLDISLPHADITEDTPFHFGSAVFDLVTHDPILDIAQSLLGGELTSNPIQHVRIKPPQREVPADETRAHIGVTAWHQDRGVGHPSADETDILTVWIAVTDATIKNGCLRLIPNPPGDMLPHCPQNQTSIPDAHLDQTRAIDAEVKAGGIVLIHPLTPHCSGPNTSDSYRWSFDIRYNMSGQNTGRQQFPDFIARSLAAPDTELRDWQTWLYQWEAARTKAAKSAHIAQHRWHTDSPACA
jgi:phytanoyl-CoA hydroxylase